MVGIPIFKEIKGVYKNMDINTVATNLLIERKEFRQQIEQLHHENKRCFFYVSIDSNSVYAVVYERPEQTSDRELILDTLFHNYIKTYPTKFTIPIYVRKGKQFTACIVSQPWIPYEQLKEYMNDIQK